MNLLAESGPNSSSCSRLLERAGLMLMAQLFAAYAIASVSFLFGATISALILPAALITGWAVAAIGASAGSRVRLLLIFVSVWAMAIVFGWNLWDYSYDGNAYHQEIIAALCDGWNPTAPPGPFSDLTLWSLHYAKGIEIIESTVVALTGNLESGKAVNIILACASGAILAGVLRQWFPTVRPAMVAAITALAICNPVFVTQAPTFYIDYAKYFYTLLTIISLISIIRAPRRLQQWMLLFMTIQLAVATKFNAFFEEGLVIALALAWLLFHRRAKLSVRIAFISLVAAAAGVLILAYHPYVTNTLTAGHPLYPLMGEGSVDIMGYNTPEIYARGNRFTNFFISMFHPLVLHYDSRLGGFGPLFLVMLAVSLAVLWRVRSPWRREAIYIAVCTLASCFIFDQSWWARYICQAWLLFPLAAIMAADSPKERPAAWWILGCGFITLLLSIPSYVGCIRVREFRTSVYETLRNDGIIMSNPNRAHLRQCAEHGITVYVNENPPDSLNRVPYFGKLSGPGIYPIMYLTPEQKRDLRNRISELPVPLREIEGLSTQ